MSLKFMLEDVPFTLKLPSKNFNELKYGQFGFLISDSPLPPFVFFIFTLPDRLLNLQ